MTWENQTRSDAPPVTFVIAAKNAARTIEASVRSVLSQQYDGHVHIVVTDDGSTDNTRKTLEQFPSVKVIRLDKSYGRSAARNRAIEVVQTPFIAIQDADDISEPWRLAKTMPLFKDAVGVAGGQIHYFTDRDGTWLSPRWNTTGEGIRAGLLSGRMSIAHPTAIMRTDLVRSVGGYDESIPFTEDYDLMLRLVPHADFVASTEFVARYRYLPRNSWSYLWKTELWRRRIMAKNGIGSERALAAFAALSTLRAYGVQTTRSIARWVK